MKNKIRVLDKCKKYELWILIAILVVALLIRLPIYKVDITGDEGKYTLGIDYPGSPLISNTLYYAQLILGFNEIIPRMITTIFALLGIWMMYLIGKQLSWKMGLAMAFVGMLLPSSIILSKSAFLDIYILFFMLLSFYLFIKIMQKPKVIYYFLLFFSAMCMSIIKPQGAMFIVPFIIYGLIFDKWKFFNKPEYYSIVFAMIPFVADYFANPARFADLFGYFASAHNLSLRGTVFNKVGVFLANAIGTELGVIILALVSLVIMFIVMRKLKISEFEKKINLLMIISFIFFLFMLSIILLNQHYYLVYLNVYESFFIAWMAVRLFELKVVKNSLVMFTSISIAIILVLSAILSATSLIGGSFMYNYYANNHQVFWQDNKDKVNGFLSSENIAVVGGNFGHHYEYYVDKPIFRTCILSQAIGSTINRAIVTNSPDIDCANYTAEIVRNWKLVDKVEDIGSLHNETEIIYMYER